MDLKLKRIFRGDKYTIGHLYIDGNYYCDVLEDTDRGLTDDMSEEEIKRIKIYGKTAVPKGRYKIEVTYSPKFKRYLPILLNVKGFTGIRIHSGNSAEDTLGCLLVGFNKEKGKVLNSRVTSDKLTALLRNCEEEIHITIE
ncbi:DUF5675 family protein [Bacteroides congonensis]|uniref:DUF5675 family protein n=1 Tax=Bacteroides congonensis TaxID=1871006 RepID=UPI000934C981|nr:DUF5675 family protein [Bacteroides congonensis]